MKKSRIITAVAATVLSATICGAAFSGCTQNDNKGDVYVFDSEITVVGGTGGGTLKDGSLKNGLTNTAKRYPRQILIPLPWTEI